MTPQNQSSDSEPGDEGDDVVHNNLNLTGAAHLAASPDDREPPTPTVLQVKMQPPTPVNNMKEQPPRHRSSTTANAAGDGVNKHHARPEEGLASTPRPRAMVDRDTETSRHLLPTPLSDHPAGPDSTARESSINVQDQPQQPIHSIQRSHPYITRDSPRTEDPQGRDHLTMTQVSKNLPLRIITSLKHGVLP